MGIFDTLFGSSEILKRLEKIMATQQEEADALNAVADQLKKATDEIVAALAKLNITSPEVDAATDRLKAASQALDDLNPDA